MGGGEGEGEGSCDNHHLISDLSEDVLIQILLWLPVISLLRFKSVCKSWRSIIQSTSFINLHFAAISSSYSMVDGSGGSLFCRGYRNNDDYSYCTLSGEELEVFEDLGMPPTLLKVMEDFVEYFVVSCCNGLICLHDSFSRNVSLWNPAIKQSRVLPKPSNLLGNPMWSENILIKNNDDGYYTCEDFVRVGIDIKTNDYKVLQITTLSLVPESRDYETDFFEHMFVMEESPPHKSRVHVYNLSTDSWRCIIDDTTLSAAHPDRHGSDLRINKGDQTLYLNGSYFFTAEYDQEDITNGNNSGVRIMLLILSFDFTEEIFRTIQPPYHCRDKTNSNGGDACLFLFGGKIALNDVKRENYWDYEYNIWVLNETPLSVEESYWTKFYTFGPYHGWNPPKCITNNGEFAIIRGTPEDYCKGFCKLQLLNIITGETKDLPCDCHDLCKLGIYKPSLVPIAGNGATDDSRFVECDGFGILVIAYGFGTLSICLYVLSGGLSCNDPEDNWK